MDELDEKLSLARQRRNDEIRLRRRNAKCIECGEGDQACITCAEVGPTEGDHIAGRKHDDTIFHVCLNCHAKLSRAQRGEPKAGEKPRNPLEVIGRWLLGLARYFNVLRITLRRFGLFLIDLARQGYGSELSLPPKF
jgi:hypothetical protein